ncbi:MAG: hypothetical protein SynsKO_42300 [Synoicihabitans sp.]
MSNENAPIQIVAYDSRWLRLFVEEREALRGVLDPWLTGTIEHIGSTAVPGLSAKPVIDIMAGVESLEESTDAIPAVRSLGYLYAPYRPEVEHWFCKPHPARRTHHLHLVPFQSALWQAQIKFRDRLRDDPTIAAEYSALKIKLAATFPHDREGYTEGKSEFINRVLGPGPKSS